MINGLIFQIGLKNMVLDKDFVDDENGNDRTEFDCDSNYRECAVVFLKKI